MSFYVDIPHHFRNMRKYVGLPITLHSLHPPPSCNFFNGNRGDDYHLELYVGLLQKQKNLLVVQPSPPIVNKSCLVFEYKNFCSFLYYASFLICKITLNK